MSGVGQKDTGPELLLRSALHRIGIRYRLHDKSLAGSPDLVFRRFRSIVFVHGCYWHSHGCYRSTVPQSRRKYWEEKFRANRKRDERDIAILHESKWRVMIVWECALVGKYALKPSDVALHICTWLSGTESHGEIVGDYPSTV